MKTKFTTMFLSLGWILFLLSLGSAYVMNSFKSGEKQFAFTPISWNEHISVFEGAISCSLTSGELQDRIDFLKKDIFSKMTKQEELAEGFIFYFEDEDQLAQDILTFIGLEKQCCPFFKFDFSVLPFKNGLALKISGSEGAKEFMKSVEGFGVDKLM